MCDSIPSYQPSREQNGKRERNEWRRPPSITVLYHFIPQSIASITQQPLNLIRSLKHCHRISYHK